MDARLLNLIKRALALVLSITLLVGNIPAVAFAEEGEPAAATEPVATEAPATEPPATEAPVEETEAPTEPPQPEETSAPTEAKTEPSVTDPQPEMVEATSVVITQEKEITQLQVGEKLQLTATVLPENATDKTVVWSSSDEAVATVDENGEVAAIAAGSVTITAACGDVAGTYELTVQTVPAETEPEVTEPAPTEPAASEPKETEEPTAPLCTGLISCTAENHLDTCEKKIADEQAATDKAAADAVSALIEVLPALEQLRAMPFEEQTPYYNQVQAAYDAYGVLTADQQALLPPAEEVFKPYFDYFNSLTEEAATAHSHPICGSSCTCTTENHTDHTWTEWKGTTTLYNGYYYLTQDVVLDSTIILDYNYNSYLCLNGHTITCEDTVFSIYSYRTLQICDCVGTGKVESTGNNATIKNNKTLSIRGGTIINSSGGFGSAIEAYSGTNTYVRGGRVESNGYYTIDTYAGSNIKIYGGTVHNSGEDGSAINGSCLVGSHTQSTLTISGGQVTSKSEYDTVNIACGSLTMSGGYIGGNAIVYDEGTTVTISGGTIDGDLDSSARTTTITGGSISGDVDHWGQTENASSISVSDVTIGGQLISHYGGTATITGGKMGLNLQNPATISAGTFHDDFTLAGEITVTGGNFTACNIGYLSENVWISGGSFHSIMIESGSLYLSGVPDIDELYVHRGTSVNAQSRDGSGSYGGEPIKVKLATSTGWQDGDIVIRNVKSNSVATKFVLDGYGVAGTDAQWMYFEHVNNNLVLRFVPHGTWGNNISWSIVDGILTISGTGSINSAYSGSDYPWGDYADEITAVVVEPGITVIPSYTFEYLENVESITLPNTVTTLALNAFNDCGKLNNLLIPESVKAITGSSNTGYPAFIRCESLTDVYYLGTQAEWLSIPNAEHVVNYGAVMTMHFLVLHENPPTCTETGTQSYYTFDDTSVYGQMYDLDKNVITALNQLPVSGHSYNQQKVHEDYLKSAATCTQQAVYYMSCECGEKGTETFTYGELGDHVRDENHRCTDCGQIGGYCGDPEVNDGKDLTWEFDEGTGTLTITGSGAMKNYGYPWSNYKETIKSVVIKKGVTNIGSGAFFGCSGLTSIEIPSGVTSIGSDAFSNCSSLTEIYIENIVAWLNIVFTDTGANPLGANYLAKKFYLNGELTTELVIPEGVTSIGAYAFDYFVNLTSVKIPSSVTSIGHYAFRGCNSLTSIEIPEHVTSIGHYAFRGCNSLTSIEIPEHVTSIGDSAFDGCCGLTSIKIPSSVTSIGTNAFFSCTNLTSVTLSEGLISMGHYAFYQCDSLTSITIPSSVTSIGSGTFAYCDRLTSVAIPSSVTSISYMTFAGSNSLKDVYYAGTQAQWNTITVDNYNEPLKDADIHYGVTNPAGHWTETTVEATCKEDGYRKDVCACTVPYERTETLPATGKHDYNKKVAEEKYLKTSATCTAAAVYHMSCECGAVGTETFEYGTALGHTGGTATCKDKAVCTRCGEPHGELGDHVRDENHKCTICGQIGGYCGDPEVNDGKNLTWEFDEGTGILTISGTGAMVDCIYSNGYSQTQPWNGLSDKIKTVVVNSGVTSIGQGAFAGIDLTSIEVPSTVAAIGADAFYGCSALQGIVIPDSVKSIGSATFCCSGLTEIEIPAGVTVIANSLFGDCTALRSVTLPAGLTTIQSWAFTGCSALTSIEIPDTVSTIGEAAFSLCSSLTTFRIPAGVTQIEDATFSMCSALTSIIIPDSVTSIGDYAFNSSYQDLNDVYYGGTEAQWEAIPIGDKNSLLDDARIHYSVTDPANHWIASTTSTKTHECSCGYVQAHTYDENNTCTICGATKVEAAQNGTAKYETLQAAISAASAGDIITLLADIDEIVGINRPLTIMVNGFSLNEDNIFCGKYLNEKGEKVQLTLKEIAGGYVITPMVSSGQEEGDAYAYIDGQESLLPLQTALDEAEKLYKAQTGTKTNVVVKLSGDISINSIVVIPSGVTLNIGAHTLSVRSLIGVEGSYLTATSIANDGTGDYGILKAAKKNVILPEAALVEASTKDYNITVLPVWNPDAAHYEFCRFILWHNATKAMGLEVDEEKEHIKFIFRHQNSTYYQSHLLNESGTDSGLRVVLEISWKVLDEEGGVLGTPYQAFVYTDKHFTTVAPGGYNYTFNLHGYSAMFLDLDTMLIQTKVISDTGAVAYGKPIDYSFDKLA